MFAADLRLTSATEPCALHNAAAPGSINVMHLTPYSLVFNFSLPTDIGTSAINGYVLQATIALLGTGKPPVTNSFALNASEFVLVNQSCGTRVLVATLTGVRPYANYTLRALVSNEEGWGAWSALTPAISTPPMPPDFVNPSAWLPWNPRPAVQNVSVIAASSTIAVLEWPKYAPAPRAVPLRSHASCGVRRPNANGALPNAKNPYLLEVFKLLVPDSIGGAFVPPAGNTSCTLVPRPGNAVVQRIWAIVGNWTGNSTAAPAVELFNTVYGLWSADVSISASNILSSVGCVAHCGTSMTRGDDSCCLLLSCWTNVTRDVNGPVEVEVATGLTQGVCVCVCECVLFVVMRSLSCILVAVVMAAVLISAKTIVLVRQRALNSGSAGAMYFFTIRTVSNLAGRGPPAGLSVGVMPAAETPLPSDPAQLLHVSSYTSRSVNTYAPAFSARGAPITSYELFVTPSGGLQQTLVFPPPVAAADGTIAFRVGNLLPGVKYAMLLVAVNRVGVSVALHLDVPITTASEVPDAPAWITSLIASAAPAADGSPALQLSWMIPANNGLPLTGYIIERCETGSASSSVCVGAHVNFSISGGSTASLVYGSALTPAGLYCATYYAFWLYALNNLGVSARSTAYLWLSPEGVPSLFAITAAGIGPLSAHFNIVPPLYSGVASATLQLPGHAIRYFVVYGFAATQCFECMPTAAAGVSFSCTRTGEVAGLAPESTYNATVHVITPAFVSGGQTAGVIGCGPSAIWQSQLQASWTSATTFSTLPNTVPVVPSLGVSNSTASSARVAWVPDSGDYMYHAFNYGVTVSTAAGVVQTSETTSAHFVDVYGLFAESNYTASVRILPDPSGKWVASATATTSFSTGPAGAPGAVLGLKVTTTSTTATATWAPPQNTGGVAAGSIVFEILYCLVAGAQCSNVFKGPVGNTTSAEALRLASSATYNFSVTALRDTGVLQYRRGPSVSVIALTKPVGAPGSPMLVGSGNVGGGHVSLQLSIEETGGGPLAAELHICAFLPTTAAPGPIMLPDGFSCGGAPPGMSLFAVLPFNASLGSHAVTIGGLVANTKYTAILVSWAGIPLDNSGGVAGGSTNVSFATAAPSPPGAVKCSSWAPGYSYAAVILVEPPIVSGGMGPPFSALVVTVSNTSGWSRTDTLNVSFSTGSAPRQWTAIAATGRGVGIADSQILGDVLVPVAATAGAIGQLPLLVAGLRDSKTYMIAVRPYNAVGGAASWTSLSVTTTAPTPATCARAVIAAPEPDGAIGLTFLLPDNVAGGASDSDPLPGVIVGGVGSKDLHLTPTTAAGMTGLSLPRRVHVSVVSNDVVSGQNYQLTVRVVDVLAAAAACFGSGSICCPQPLIVPAFAGPPGNPDAPLLVPQAAMPYRSGVQLQWQNGPLNHGAPVVNYTITQLYAAAAPKQFSSVPSCAVWGLASATSYWVRPALLRCAQSVVEYMNSTNCVVFVSAVRRGCGLFCWQSVGGSHDQCDHKSCVCTRLH